MSEINTFSDIEEIELFIGEEQFIEQELFALSARWSLGPLSTEVESIKIDEVKVSVKLLGTKVAAVTLKPDKSFFNFNVNVGLAKLELALRADFSKKVLRAEGKVCGRKLPTSWSCKSFNTTIISW